MGIMIDAVVTKATVDEPWAVFIAAAKTKGKKIPMLYSVSVCPKISAIPEFCKIFPNIPPAPVIKIIDAASLIALPTHPEDDSIS